MSGGGGSKEQTVGYRYYFGIHMGIGRGPVDELHEVTVGDRTIWKGQINSNSSVEIDQYNLFGGEEKEGGVKGTLEVMMGGATQEACAGLKSMRGNTLPGFRGVLSAFFNGLVCMNNPYPKSWKFRLNRTMEGWDGGAPWYPEKCRIMLYAGHIEPAKPYVPEIGIEGATLISNISILGINATADASSGTVTISSGFTDKDWLVVEKIPGNVNKAWSNVSSDSQMGGKSWTNNFRVSDSYGTATNHWSNFYATADQARDAAIIDPVFISGSSSYTFWLPDSIASDNRGTWSVKVSSIPRSSMKIDPPAYSMNAAHIIYECLTNRVWGRGMPSSKIDDASFRAAADTLYSEGFGLCMKWVRKDEIATFIQSVLDHIGASLYVSRSTGLMTLKLIRADYTLSALPVFDTESGILEISELSVSSVGGSVNAVYVTYRDWLSDEDKTVGEKNGAAIAAAGGVINSVTKSYPGIPTSSLALRVALRDLRSSSVSLRRFKLIMDRRAEGFEPGSVFAVQDPKRGIPKMAVRVGQVEDGTISDGRITLTVAQDVFSLPANPISAEVPNTWEPPNSTPCIDQTLVMEVPYFILAGSMSKADLDYMSPDSGYIGALASKGQAMNQGFEMAVRTGAPTIDDNPPDDRYVCQI